MNARYAALRIGRRGKAEGATLLSICIPTYNRAQYLAAALDSLIPQLAGDVELLVYDTGSTDGTEQMMQAYVERLPSMRFFSLPEKLGFDETVLLLLGETRGEYVWLFGSDDVAKPEAVATVRGKIQECSARPALIYLNHEIVDLHGKVLIASNIGRAADRQFGDGRSCVAWLGLHLGYISACIFRAPDRAAMERAREFVGRLWMGLHFNLVSVSSGAPAIYVGRPLVSSRRNPANTYDYGTVFVRDASFVFWASRRYHLGAWTIYRAMNSTVRALYSRLGAGWRCDQPEAFRPAFRAMLRTCWMYPWFWLLIVPLRVVPADFVRATRNVLHRRRAWRNGRLSPGARAAGEFPARLD